METEQNEHCSKLNFRVIIKAIIIMDDEQVEVERLEAQRLEAQREQVEQVDMGVEGGGGGGAAG
jgi:hypothetical protein